MSTHEFIKRAPDGISETSFSKAILQMLADPFEQRLSENLQFLLAADDGLRPQPIKLLRCQPILDRRVNLVGFVVPERVCLVAISHLVNRLVSLSAFSGHPPDRFRTTTPAETMRNVASTTLSPGRTQSGPKALSFHVFYEFQQIEI